MKSFAIRKMPMYDLINLMICRVNNERNSVWI